MHSIQDRVFTRDFLWAFAANLSVFGSFYLLLATLPLFIGTIGGTESDVGLILGSFAITAVVFRAISGGVADRRGFRVLMLVGSIAILTASFLYATATSLPMLLLLRILHGIGWAVFGTACSALAAEIVPARRRGEAIGYFGMSTNVAMAIGPALGLLLAERTGYGVLFLISGAVAAVGFLGSLAVREPVRKHVERGGHFDWRNYLSPPAFFPGLVLLLISLTYASVLSFLPLFAERQLIGNSGLFFTVYAVVLLITRGPLGRLSDLKGRVAVIAPGALMMGISLFVLAWSDSLWQMLLVAALYGIGWAAVLPTLMAFAVDRAGIAQRGAAMGTVMTAMDLGVGVGSFVWGYVAQSAGFSVLFAAAGSAAVLATVVALLGGRTWRHRRPSVGQTGS